MPAKKQKLLKFCCWVLGLLVYWFIFKSPVWALSCSCGPEVDSFSGEITGCVPVDTDYCGPGWQCKCPDHTREGCENGTCVAKNPEGGCPNQGDLAYGITADNEEGANFICQNREEGCSLSGNIQTYTDEYGNEHILTYECCCPHDRPTPPKEEEGPSIGLLKPEECCLGKRVDNDCAAKDRGIQTALGCFPTNPSKIIEWILKYSIMFAGGIGFLIMLFASFTIMTASGDPEKLKNGQQMLGSAIAGILLVAFALFLLRFIGVTVLQLPGWGG